ncbi:MAG: MATE family efflux transporter [Gammaproteobacteria bacterium]
MHLAASTVGAELRALIALGAPLILNSLFSIGVSLGDTMMAARLGPTQLAGVALGNGLWIAAFLFGLGVVMALGPTVAQHFGAGRHAEIGPDLRQGLWLALAVAALVVAALRHMDPVFALFGIAPEVAMLAQGYLDHLCWGVPAAFAYHAFKQLHEGIGRTVPVMVVMAVALPVNVLLNYGFLFGRLGLPALGAPGCGLGTGITFWLMLTLLAGHARRALDQRQFALWARFDWPDAAVMRRLVALGLPIGLSLLLQSGLFTVIALLIGRLGSAAVAAHQVALNVCGLVFTVPAGLAMALAVRVGQAAGRGDARAVRRIGTIGILLCGGCSGTAALVTWFLAAPIVALYSQDPQVTAIALSLSPLAAALQFADGVQVATAFALRGLKDARVPLLLNAATYWGVGFTLAWLGAHRPAPAASDIWLGIVAALWVVAALLITRFARLTARMLAETGASTG